MKRREFIKKTAIAGTAIAAPITVAAKEMASIVRVNHTDKIFEIPHDSPLFTNWQFDCEQFGALMSVYQDLQNAINYCPRVKVGNDYLSAVVEIRDGWKIEFKGRDHVFLRGATTNIPDVIKSNGMFFVGIPKERSPYQFLIFKKAKSITFSLMRVNYEGTA